MAATNVMVPYKNTNNDCSILVWPTRSYNNAFETEIDNTTSNREILTYI